MKQIECLMSVPLDDENGLVQYGRTARETTVPFLENKGSTTPPAFCPLKMVLNEDLIGHLKNNSNSSSIVGIIGDTEDLLNYELGKEHDEEEETEEEDDGGYGDYEIYGIDCLFRYVCAAGVRNLAYFYGYGKVFFIIFYSILIWQNY